MLLLKEGGVQNVMTQTWLCDSESEVSNIPETAPAGSVAFILTDEGLTIQMKNNTGEWLEI